MADIATLGLRVDADGAIRAVKDFGDEAERTAHKGEALERVAHRVTEAFVGYEAVRWAKETLELGARYQTLGVVMNVVGANAGKSAAEMSNLQASLQQTGISMIESRNNLARMAQAHLNLADASKLARVAQDAAVIGNINSSEAFERMIHGIEAAEPMILRSIGINVGFQESYEKAARAAGTTVDALTEHERTQVRANAVMEAGGRIAGTYEAAMNTAGKQINSTTRYLEDARVKVSEAFQPQFTAAVFAYADALKFAGNNTGAIVGALKLLITAGELAATVYIGKLVVSGAAWASSLIAQRTATIAAATATVEATALEATAAQVRLAAATNRLRANTALLASEETLIAAEHALALAQIRVAMTADAAAASEVALARASTVAGAAISTAGTLAARGWALIGGPIGAAMIAAIGINALLDKWIDKQMKAVELTADQEAAFTKALAAAHAHAPKPPEDPAAQTERARKAKELLHEREGELQKQAALNAAFGQTDLTLKILGIRYDAMIQKSQDAKNYKGKELEALNAVTDALTRQKIQAEQLADAQATRDRDRSLRIANANVETADAIRKNVAKNAQDAAQSDAALAGVAAQVERVKKAFRDAQGPGPDEKEKRYQDDMRKEWRRGLDNMLTGGLRSWSSFFDSVFGLFRRLMDRMEREGTDSGLGYGALRLGAAALGGGMAGFGVGQSVYSSSHGAAGNTARGALGGAAAGAAAGSAFGGIGAAVGALAGLAGGIFGIGSAAKEAAKAMADAVKQVTLSMDALRADVHGDVLGQGIAAIEADRERQRKMIEDAWSGGDANSDRVQWRTKKLAELNALEDERIAKLREEYAQARQRAAEDLRVRLLTAQGRAKEAETLRLQLAQERERQDLVKSFGDVIDPTEAATLSLLDQVQAQEKLAAATNRATTSALNMVEGYNIVAEAFRFSGMTSGMGGGTTSGGGGYGSTYTPSGPIAVPTGGSRGTPQPTEPVMMQPVVLEVNGRELARVVKQVFIDDASKSGDGDSYNWGRGT